MENTDKSWVLDKIQKLLKVAAEGSGASVNEAETAARQAAALMRKWNIDSAEIQLKNIDQGLGEEIVAEFAYSPRHRIQRWEGQISVAVAKLFDCQVDLYTKPSGDSEVIRFMGYETDVVVSTWMLTYLIRTVESLAKKFMGDKKSFTQGATAALCKRLREMREARDAEFKGTTTGTALVVVNRKAEEIAKVYGAPRYSSSRSHVRDGAAYYEGHKAGSSINLPTGAIPNKNPPRLS